jgi:hypothetical protein
MRKLILAALIGLGASKAEAPRTSSPMRKTDLRRRGLLLTGFAALAASAMPAHADPAPITPIQQLTDGLLRVMKTGPRTQFKQRFDMLAPVIDQVFDLDAVLRTSVGSAWASLPADQQDMLRPVFRRYTVASYVNNFNSFNGQQFTIEPQTRPVGSGVICATLAFCCNDWVAHEPPPRWLRAAESAGCAITVAAGLTLMVGFDLFPRSGILPNWLIVVLPSIMSAMIGGYVPHIYRTARRVAAARAIREIRNPASATSKAYESSTACAARTAVRTNHEQRLVIAA